MDNLTPYAHYLFWIIAVQTCATALLTLLTQNVVRSATWLLFTLAGTGCLFFLLGADVIGAAQILIYVGGTLVLLIFGVMLTAQDPFINMKTGAAEWALSLVVGIALFSVLTIGAMSAAGPTPRGEVAKHGPHNRLSNDPSNSQYTDALGLGFLGEGVGPANRVSGLVVKVTTNDNKQFVAYGEVLTVDSKQVQRTPIRQPHATDVLDDGLMVDGKRVPLAELPVTLPGMKISLDGKELTRDGKAVTVDRGVVRTSYLLPFEIVSVHLLVVLIGAAYLARAKRRKGATA